MLPYFEGKAVLAVLWAGLFNIVSGASQCYKVDGTPQSVFSPCDPDAKISSCCASVDYCMSNGLCLDAGVNNNLFSVQGCTDKNWGLPCYKPCTGPIDNRDIGVISLIACNGDNKYCCGVNSDCCNNASNLINVPVASEVFKAPTGASTSSSGSNPPPTPLNTASSSSSTSSNTHAGSDSGSDNRSLAVGLGVGIPLGLILIGAIAFFGWQLKRRNDAHATHRLPPRGAVSEYPISPHGMWNSLTSPHAGGYSPSGYSPPNGGFPPAVPPKFEGPQQRSELSQETRYDRATELPTGNMYTT